MRRLLALLFVLAMIAAACGGGGDDDVADSPADEGGDETTDDGGDDGSDDDGGDDSQAAEEAEDGGALSDEGGGSADQDLTEEQGLPECPVGAHLEADGPVEISFWHPFTALTGEAMDDLAARFNASQDQIVVVSEAQGSYAETLAKYREGITFDDVPGVVIADQQALREMVDSGAVLPAQSCVEADGFDLSVIDESVRANFSIDGALYPGAMLVSTPVLYYNRADFTAAGLDPEAPPQTLAEMADAARALKAAGVSETPLSLLLQGWFLDTWLTGADVPLVNAGNGRAGNATEAVFNTPEGVEILTILQEMNDEGLIVGFSNTPGQVSQYLAMATPGVASMAIETSTASTTIAGILGGSSNLSELVESSGVDIAGADLTIDLNVAPLPGLNEPGQIFASGGAFYMSNLGSDAELAAAWEFIKFINETEQQKLIHLKGSYLPIRPDVVSDPEVEAVWANDPAGQWLSTAYGQLGDIDPDFPGPAVGPFTEQRELFNALLDELILGGGDPAALLEQAEADLTEALEDYADANF